MILLLLCGIAFGFKAGDQHFWGRHGEARRAEVSREMVASGNWVVPHLNGEPFVTKPPLYYWAAAAAFTRLFEVLDFLDALHQALFVALLFEATERLFKRLIGLDAHFRHVYSTSPLSKMNTTA